MSALCTLALGCSRNATYSLTATTETASIVIRDPKGVSVRLPRVRIWKPGATGQTPVELCCSIELEASDGDRLTLSRKLNGDLLVQLNWNESAPSGATLVLPDGAAKVLDSGDVLQVVLNRPVKNDPSQSTPDTAVLVFRGELKVGDDVAPLAERTLLSGTVKIVEATLVGKDRYAVSEATLDPGDSVAWRGPDPLKPVVVSGFVHVGSAAGVREALQVTAYAAADRLEVQRFGAVAYDVKPSPVDRLTRDPELSMAVTLIVALGALAAVVEAVRNYLCSDTKTESR